MKTNSNILLALLFMALTAKLPADIPVRMSITQRPATTMPISWTVTATCDGASASYAQNGGSHTNIDATANLKLNVPAIVEINNDNSLADSFGVTFTTDISAQCVDFIISDGTNTTINDFTYGLAAGNTNLYNITLTVTISNSGKTPGTIAINGQRTHDLNWSYVPITLPADNQSTLYMQADTSSNTTWTVVGPSLGSQIEPSGNQATFIAGNKEGPVDILAYDNSTGCSFTNTIYLVKCACDCAVGNCSFPGSSSVLFDWDGPRISLSMGQHAEGSYGDITFAPGQYTPENSSAYALNTFAPVQDVLEQSQELGAAQTINLAQVDPSYMFSTIDDPRKINVYVTTNVNLGVEGKFRPWQRDEFNNQYILRQVITPTILVDIKNNALGDFTATFYNASAIMPSADTVRQIDPSAIPICSHRFQNSNGDISTQIYTEIKYNGSMNNPTAHTHIFQYDFGNNKWTYTMPDGIGVQKAGSTVTTYSSGVPPNQTTVTNVIQSHIYSQGTTTIKETYVTNGISLNGTLIPIAQLDGATNRVPQHLTRFTSKINALTGTHLVTDVFYYDGQYTHYDYDGKFRKTQMSTGSLASNFNTTIYTYTNSVIGNIAGINDTNYAITIPRIEENYAMGTLQGNTILNGTLISRTYHYLTTNTETIIREINPSAGLSTYNSLVGNPGNVLVTRNTYDAYGLLYTSLKPNNTAIMNINTIGNDDSYGIVTTTGIPTLSGTTVTAINTGFRTTQTYSPANGMTESLTERIEPGKTITLAHSIYTYDSGDSIQSSPTITNALNNTSIVIDRSCCGDTTIKDADNNFSQTFTDALKRPNVQTYGQGQNIDVTIQNDYDAANNVLRITQDAILNIPYASSTITNYSAYYDTAGFQTSVSDETRIGYINEEYYTNQPASGFVRKTSAQATTTTPAKSIATLYYPGGEINRVTGDTEPVRYTYTVETVNNVAERVVTIIPLITSGTALVDATNITKIYYNPLGLVDRVAKNTSNGFVYTVYAYNKNGLESITDPENNKTYFTYNPEGVLTRVTKLPAAASPSDFQNFTETIVSYLSADANPYGVDVIKYTTFAATNSAVKAKTREIYQATSGTNTWYVTFAKGDPSQPITVNVNVVLNPNDTSKRQVVTTYSDQSKSYQNYQFGKLVDSYAYINGQGYTTTNTYTANPTGTLNKVGNANSGYMNYLYNHLNMATNVTAVPNGLSAQANNFILNQEGLLKQNLLNDNSAQNVLYDTLNRPILSYGDQTYATGYAYDEMSRLRYLTNWTQFSYPTGSNPRVTEFLYDPYTGWLKQRKAANNKSIVYSYNNIGQPNSITLARNLAVTLQYTPTGTALLSSVMDESTPLASYTYDQAGRKYSATFQTQNIATNNTIIYNRNGANGLDQQSFTAGILANWSIATAFDNLNRITNHSIQYNGTAQAAIGYKYNNNNTVDVVIGLNKATLSYTLSKPSVFNVAYTYSNGPAINQTYTLDNLGRLATASFNNSFQYTYSYNNLNQISGITNLDASSWAFSYDSLGQVFTGVKYTASGNLTAGQQFSYTYDSIGNRTSTAQGGNAFGNGKNVTTYGTGTLNNVTNILNPGYASIRGTANAGASVKVNGLDPDRQGNYFHQNLAVDPASIQSVATVARLGTDTASKVTYIMTPGGNETCVCDDDGNITSDSRWNYAWDKLNRLTSMTLKLSTSNTNIPTQLLFDYDPDGKRISKIVKNCQNAVLTSTKYLYVGWKLAAEIDNNYPTVLSKVFAWSGNKLLFVTIPSGISAGSYQVVDDGRGNVTALQNPANSQIAAYYEYGPFGETIRAQENSADTSLTSVINPFRFSSEYTDVESGLIYYGLRYYNPNTGRWLNPDPIKEQGGVNLYGFCGNDPVNYRDYFGLQNLRVRTPAEEMFENLSLRLNRPANLEDLRFSRMVDCRTSGYEREIVRSPYRDQINNDLFRLSLKRKGNGLAFEPDPLAMPSRPAVAPSVQTATFSFRGFPVTQMNPQFLARLISVPSETQNIVGSPILPAQSSSFSPQTINTVQAVSRALNSPTAVNPCIQSMIERAQKDAESRTKWGPEHGVDNVEHNNAIEDILDSAHRRGFFDIRKNRVQRDVNGNRVYTPNGNYIKPDASWIDDGTRYNHNRVSRDEDIDREINAFNKMIHADPNAVNSLEF